LVIEVNSAPSALKQDRQEMLYSALKTSLDGQNPPIFSSDPQALQEALGALANTMAQSERASAASAALAKVENENRSKAERLAASENFGPSGSRRSKIDNRLLFQPMTRTVCWNA
ncbi:MAG: hypothetical protein ACC642_08760, partial [Pseudomonadales bacterium]